LRALPGVDQLIVAPAGNATIPPAGRGGGSQTILICAPDRPLLTLAMLMEFMERTEGDRVAALASPASDTYKVVRAGMVQSTLDRATLWELQGLSRFNQGSFDRLPDLELARLAGIPVRLIRGDPMNFAVRSADDCRVAERVLSK